MDSHPRPSHTRNAHDHQAGHDHKGHSHQAHVDTNNERRVLLAMLLTGGFMVAEVIGGILSGSLALLADAGHMLTDSAALALAWIAFRVARRPADPRRSYGYHRFQVLAAFLNGVTLLALVGWILFEAVSRMLEPVPILGTPMLVIAALGLGVNIAAFVILQGADRQNLNIRGAAMHVLGDLLGSVAAIVAALVILATGWTLIDPLLSVLVAMLIVRSAWDLVRRSSHILLEGTPEGFDRDAVCRELTAELPDLEDIHHVHAWSLADGQTVMTLHAAVPSEANQAELLARINHVLQTRFHVAHATVQLETHPCPDRVS